MRYIFGALFLAAFGWAAYWFVGSNAQQNAIKNWLDTQGQSGWVANYSDINVQGFPNRFDTQVSDLELADPNYGWSVALPDLSVMQLSYQPNHIIAQFPQSGRVATPFGTVQVLSENIQASVLFEPSTRLALNRSTVTLADVRMTSTQGWTTKINDAVLATRQTDANANAHEIAFDANGVTPALDLKNQLDPKGILPNEFETLSIRTNLHFDAPWDLPAIEGVKPALTRIDLEGFDAVWGKLTLQAKGAMDVDRFGYPTGKLSVRAKNWREMLDVAVSSGVISKEMKSTVETGLRLLAGLSGGKKTLDIPLSFKNKTTYVGPIPVGPAPVLILR
jgi:hypothetical protein